MGKIVFKENDYFFLSLFIFRFNKNQMAQAPILFLLHLVFPYSCVTIKISWGPAPS